MATIPINGTFLKIYNRAQILNIIRQKHSISRVHLAELTGLSRTAIGSLISELIEDNYIEEVGVGESRGGRKPILLQLKNNAYFSIGVEVSLTSIRVVFIDLKGSTIVDKLFERLDGTNFSLTFRIIEEKIKILIETLSIPITSILGISLAIPGAVNDRQHKIIYSPSLTWENIIIPKHFEGLPTLPLFLENDANACAIYENWLGVCRGINDFVCLVHTTGIGAGVFVNGRLYRGTDGVSAQIGHIQVNENGPLCACGNFGCLEVMAGHDYGVKKFTQSIRQGITTVSGIEKIEDININTLHREAQNGNDIAMNILEESATYLGVGISILLNILNPTVIVLGKGFDNFPKHLIHLINKVVENKVMRIYKSNINIISSNATNSSVALGAAIIPIKPIFGEETDLC